MQQQNGFVTNWPEFNQALGEGNCLYRGMTVLIGQPTHTITNIIIEVMFFSAAKNGPLVLDGPEKTPMLMYLSTDREFVDEVPTTAMGDLGWAISATHIDTDIFRYEHLVDLVTKHESEGYEIQGCWLDNEDFLSNEALSSSKELDQVVRELRRFMSEHNILFVNNHLTSNYVRNLEQMNKDALIKEIVNFDDRWEGPKRLPQEFDMEIFVGEIIDDNDKLQVGLHIGKHRSLHANDKDKRLCYMPLTELVKVPQMSVESKHAPEQ